MTTRTFNVSALSPILKYDPPQDVTNSVWKSDPGGIDNGNPNTGNPTRVLGGTGTVTVSAFGSGLGFSGSITGVYCTYTATLSPGEGNSQSTPYPQTSSPATGMLASFTGLPIGNWVLELKGNCGNGSKIKVANAIIDGWVGTEGGEVSTKTLDGSSPDLVYSGVDWSDGQDLRAVFYNDTQHYTSSRHASMNYTFSGTGIVVWSSADGQHGPFAASLHYASSTYDDRNTLYSSGYNPFLVVPVPFFLVTGLDPSQSYTLVLQNKAINGTYLDLDYIEVYTSTGGGPPNGGTSAVHSLTSPSNQNTIIGGALGGAVGLLLLLVLLWYLWRRRKIKIDRGGGTRPIDPTDNIISPVGHHPIPLQMQGNVLPTPFHFTEGSAEQQGLLQNGDNSPRNGNTPNAATFSAPSPSGYNPYASLGGAYPSPHMSSNTAGTRLSFDPVHARRQGKAAEIDAARERASRIYNNNSGGLATGVSPATPHVNTHPHNSQPNLNLNGDNNTHSTSQSWDASSQGPSTPGPPSNSNANAGTDFKTPDDPPPSYENP